MGKIDKISLKNFKSFKKADVPVAKGYTTIIGPNGSGKSNLIDALCFAIGTSSMKNLRADRLTDLVFDKSPDGTATVEIEFKDAQDDKYSISRTIDKQGQSVFRVDGKRTTKFHVEEQLRKMNVHADGHNIVMQGDVTRFIKMTPMQRRGVIDEVSGIAEYEDKKQESMRELIKVEEKVKESAIVLSEKQGYLKVLEKEKIEAEVYTKLRDSAKKYEATLVKKDLDTIEKTFTKATEFINKAKEEIDEKKKEQSKYYKLIEEIGKKADELEKKIFQEADKKQLGLQKEVEETKAKIIIIEDRMKQQKEGIESNLHEIENINKIISDIGNEIKLKEKSTDSFSKDEDDLLKKLHEKQRELESFMKKTGIGKGFEKALKELDELGTEIEKQKEKMSKINSDISTIDERRNLKKAALDAKNKEAGAFREKYSELESRIKALESDKEKSIKNISNIEKESEKFFEMEKHDNIKISKLEKDLSTFKQKHSNLSGKISAVKSIEGMNEAVKAITEASKRKELKGILGTVGELCKYKQEHSTAIETAAGTKMFYLITETADDATEAVKYIKKNKLGRASFIPLDKIKSSDISKDNQSLSSHKGAVDFAINLVDFDNRYLNVFKFILGDTLVVNDIDSVKDIGVGRVRMTTLDGDLAEFSGLITGGFSKKTITQNDLKELTELDDNIKSLEEDRKAVFANLESSRKRISDLRDEKSKEELKSKETEVMLKEINERIKEYSGNAKPTAITELENEIKGLEKAASEKQSEKEVLEKELNILLAKRTKEKEQLNIGGEKEDISDELNKIQSEVQQLKDDLNDFKVKRTTIVSEIENVLIKKRKDLQEQIKKIEKINKELDEKSKQLSNERNEAFKLLKEKEEHARKAATSMTDLYAEKEKIEKERNIFGNKIGEFNREIDKIKEEMSLREIDKAKVEQRYIDLKKQWEKFKDVEILEITRKELEEKLAETQKHLENIGNVNMKAIEMFNEYSTDVKEITEKKKKLETEKDAIMKLVQEIEQRKYTVFMETFIALNKNFNKYLKLLYPEEGSEASLSLDNPENPFDGGLLLTARPAGKPVKVIDLLSGGEKTLTAIAFLFAVMAYKPSPFYILDEVDAALDPENSTRMAKMIKKASDELQFIIVTHNPVVSRESDQIIGVHKSKDGSSIIEVDLKSYTLGDLANPAKNF